MNIAASVVRTVVPVVVGAISALVAHAGIALSSEVEAQITVVVGAVVAAVYHWVVRMLEERWPLFGWLLGFARCPDYRVDDSFDYESSAVYDEQGRVVEIKTVSRYRYHDHPDE